jgi:hypothetical protein
MLRLLGFLRRLFEVRMANPLGRLGVCAENPCGAPPGDCDDYCTEGTAVQCYQIVIAGSSTVNVDGVSINGTYVVEASTISPCVWIADYWCSTEDASEHPQCFYVGFTLNAINSQVGCDSPGGTGARVSIGFIDDSGYNGAFTCATFEEETPGTEPRDCGVEIELVETGAGGGTATITALATTCDAYWTFPCIAMNYWYGSDRFCIGCQPQTVTLTVDFLAGDYAAYNGAYELTVQGDTEYYLGDDWIVKPGGQWYQWQGTINSQTVTVTLWLDDDGFVRSYGTLGTGIPYTALWTSPNSCLVGRACMSWADEPVLAQVPPGIDCDTEACVYHGSGYVCTAYLTSGEECVTEECPPWEPGDDPECACATDPDKAVFDPADEPPCCVYAVITNTSATLHSGAALSNRVLRARITGSASACLYYNEYGCEEPIPEEDACDCFVFTVTFVRGGFGYDPDEVRVTAELRYRGDDADSGLIFTFADTKDYPVSFGETGIVLSDVEESGAQITLTEGANTWDECEASSYDLESMRMDLPESGELGCLPLALTLTCVYDTACNALTILAGEYGLTHVSACDREDYEAVFGAVTDLEWYDTLRYSCQYYYFGATFTIKYILGGTAGGMYIEFFDNAAPSSACYSYLMEWAESEDPRFACDHSVKGQQFDLYQIVAAGGCAPLQDDWTLPYRRLRFVYPS